MKWPASVHIIPWLLFPAVSAGAFEFSRPIENPRSLREEFLAVTLDSLVYSHTRDGFADLRLVDQANSETPYLIDQLRSRRNETTRKFSKARIVSLEHSGSRAIEIQLGLNPDDPPAQGLKLYTPLVNFEHRVRVFGSMEGTRWSPLVEDAVIYDYSKFIDLRNSEIALPVNAYRRLKVRVEEPIQDYESENLELTRELEQGQEQARRESTQIRRMPLRIDRIDYWHSLVEPG
ncbi:MAG: hypothetical protein L0Y38_00865, partial [Methylococcaceae bacterium]|nr:hypothetical protein [Methylococcaceae bacterium]